MQQPESGLRALESARHDSAIRISDAQSLTIRYTVLKLSSGARVRIQLQSPDILGNIIS